MYQRDHDIVFPKVPVEARAAPDKFIDFSGDFDAAEARSHDDETEVPAAALWIQRGLGLFHLTHDVLAKINRIAHDFERERVLDHSGDNSQVAFGTASNDHVVVMHAGRRAISVLEFNLRAGEVYSLRALGSAIDARKHLPQRGCSCVRIDRSSRYIRQEWVKDHVILAAEQENFALGGAELLSEVFRELNGRKTPTNDYYSDWLHSLSPVAPVQWKLRVPLRAIVHTPTSHLSLVAGDAGVFRKRANSIEKSRRNRVSAWHLPMERSMAVQSCELSKGGVMPSRFIL
jgi:hypothetical protein